MCVKAHKEVLSAAFNSANCQELRDHREVCAWVCSVEGCGEKAKKERDISQHQSKHPGNYARRAAIFEA